VKPKILFLIGSLEVGGAERFLKELVRRIPRDRFEAKVVCIATEGPWGRELRAEGFDVVVLNKRLGFDPVLPLRLTALVRGERPAIVNTHLWTADLWGRMAAIAGRVPRIVVTEQTVDLWKRWPHRLIDRLLVPFTDHVICVCPEVASFYARRGVPAAKLHIIPNAIDIAPYDRPPQSGLRLEVGGGAGEFLFICAARLHPQKAHTVLLHATDQLARAGGSSFKLLLVGDGPLRKELEQQVRGTRLEKRVCFLGLRHDVPDILLQANALVLSSRYEGLPLAILEAMAARLPVVATRVGGNATLVEDGLTGWLVPPDDPRALAEAMARLLRDPIRARRMGEEGRRRVERDYRIESAAAQTVAFFEACLPPR
jgi:glycosyltransferase involved in cell wall biosynthesis